MKSEFLSKKYTQMLHGIAILMMIYHHLFISGNTWFVNKATSLLDVFDCINIGNSGSAQLTFAWFCKICVAIFAFTSGYAMYKQFDSRRTDDKIHILDLYKYCVKRWWSFYKKYLLAFLVFVSLEYFMGNQEGFDFTISNYLLSLIGVKAAFNGTWWYIPVYYGMLVLSPIFYVILDKFKLKHYLLVVGVVVLSVVISYFAGYLLPYYKFLSGFIQNYVTDYILIFAEGMFVCKYCILDYIGNKLNAITSLLILVVVYVLRALLIRAPSDWFFDLILIIPFVVSITKLFAYSEKVVNFFGYFGKYSAYMWYAHAYFYAYLFYNIVFKCDLSFVVYIQVVGYSLVSAIILTFIEKGISKLFKH